MKDAEKAFEAWWQTQLVPADDQRDWYKPLDNELYEQANAMMEISKMWARRGFMEAWNHEKA